jgi:uncharacterized membrane protein YqiK
MRVPAGAGALERAQEALGAELAYKAQALLADDRTDEALQLSKEATRLRAELEEHRASQRRHEQELAANRTELELVRAQAEAQRQRDADQAEAQRLLDAETVANTAHARGQRTKKLFAAIGVTCVSLVAAITFGFLGNTEACLGMLPLVGGSLVGALSVGRQRKP